ncbi:MAG: type III pantothenate kinase [Balneola sp.]
MSKNDSVNPKKTLFVDIGNSSIKVAYVESGVWQKVNDNFKSVTYFISWLTNHYSEIQKLIIASVRKDHLNILEQSIQGIDYRVITTESIDSEKLDYETPKTLGIDRYLVCLGALSQVHKKPSIEEQLKEENKVIGLGGRSVIAVDAGSACTIDCMHKEEIFIGGMILPGISAFIQSLNKVAPELPETELEFASNWIGKSTKESLILGRLDFFALGIAGIFERLRTYFPGAKVFITGGDAQIFSECFKFVERGYSDPVIDEFLIFKGMKTFIDE